MQCLLPALKRREAEFRSYAVHPCFVAPSFPQLNNCSREGNDSSDQRRKSLENEQKKPARE
jgi:hypothetical protein